MIEPFNWLNTVDYKIYIDYSKHRTFEQMMPHIVKGEFGSALHKAAAKCMLLEIVHNSGFIPFSYKVRKYVYQNFEYWCVIDVRIFDMDTKWIHRLKLYVESGKPFPCELIESAWTLFGRKPQWWVDIAHVAFSDVFGRCEAFWTGEGVFGITDINFNLYIESQIQDTGEFLERGGQPNLLA